MSVALKEQIIQRLEKLPQAKLNEVLLFVEFLSAREPFELTAYVNERSEQARKAKQRGEKFYTLEELQKEFKR
ncbi:hypothetical protein HYR99_21965 [Candidatus Poribacteria bacterium]|nr:hypothetical protein [Candidatus Poribacteria bacterium]